MNLWGTSPESRGFAPESDAKEIHCSSKAFHTRDQKSAIKVLNDWTPQYRAIAKVALHGKKELLEKLGLLTRSTKTPAQRNAPKKAAETRKRLAEPSV